MHDTATAVLGARQVREGFLWWPKTLPSEQSFNNGFGSVGETRWLKRACWVQYMVAGRSVGESGRRFVWIDLHWGD